MGGEGMGLKGEGMGCDRRGGTGGEGRGKDSRRGKGREGKVGFLKSPLVKKS